MRKYQKKWFTLTELIIVITVLSIIWSFGYLKYGNNEVENYLSEYKSQIIQRVDDLYKKSLISINWHYNNNWVTDVKYLKLYCDEVNKTFYAYACDKTNSTSPDFNNCKQIDFPTLDNIRYWNILSTYTKKDIDINHCMYIDQWWSIFNNWSFYITINTWFPNWEIETYKENATNSKDNELDDTIVDNVKINIKHEAIVKEFYPIYFK